jgi:hypothetical protein
MIMGIRKKTDVDLFLEWVKRSNDKKFTFHGGSDHKIILYYEEDDKEWFIVEDEDDEDMFYEIPDPGVWVWERRKEINKALTKEVCIEIGLKVRDYSKPSVAGYWRGKGKKPRPICSECGMYMRVIYMRVTEGGKRKYIECGHLCRCEHTVLNKEILNKFENA